MREIKFRAKRNTGEWVYGFLVKTKEGLCWIVNYPTDEPEMLIGYAIEVNPETVGQYTGLKDSYGNEIYEGDWEICYTIPPRICTLARFSAV